VPIVLQKYPNADTEMAVWKITESVDELRNLLWMFPHEEFKFERRTRQWLSSRLVLQEVLKDKIPHQPLTILKHPNGRPFIDGLGWNFSMSHSGNYAAVLVSKTSPVGIDIEEISERIKKIARKFINDYEWQFLVGENDLHTMYLLWSAKEAIFKWFGDGQVDFKKHMQVFFPIDENSTEFEAVLLKEKEYNLTVHTEKVDEQYRLCWVC
jgi:4'-phosphopantetheinyl transferase